MGLLEVSRLHIVLVNIVDTPIARGLRSFQVVIFISFISNFVFESCIVNIFTKIIQFLNIVKNQTTSSDVIHSCKFHFREPFQLPEYCNLALMALTYNNSFGASTPAQKCLKCIEHGRMCGTPTIDALEIIICRRTASDGSASLGYSCL